MTGERPTLDFFRRELTNHQFAPTQRQIEFPSSDNSIQLPLLLVEEEREENESPGA